MGYDALDRPATLQDSSGFYWVRGVIYNAANQPVQTQLQYSSRVAFYENRGYNAMNQLTHIDHFGGAFSVNYNYPAGADNGQISSAVDNNVTISYAYDALKRLTSAVGSGWSRVTRYSYQGNNATVTDAAGKWKTTTVVALGNTTQVLEPDGLRLQFVLPGYDRAEISGVYTLSVDWDLATQRRRVLYPCWGQYPFARPVASIARPDAASLTRVGGAALMIVTMWTASFAWPLYIPLGVWCIAFLVAYMGRGAPGNRQILVGLLFVLPIIVLITASFVFTATQAAVGATGQ